jgi:hypothetical protein
MYLSVTALTPYIYYQTHMFISIIQYTNNHLMAVMSESSGDGLAVSLVDTVAGKLLHRVVHANAAITSPG